MQALFSSLLVACLVGPSDSLSRKSIGRSGRRALCFPPLFGDDVANHVFAPYAYICTCGCHWVFVSTGSRNFESTRKGRHDEAMMHPQRGLAAPGDRAHHHSDKGHACGSWFLAVASPSEQEAVKGQRRAGRGHELMLRGGRGYGDAKQRRQGYYCLLGLAWLAWAGYELPR